MQILEGQLFYSPSDLITFMESPFASHMERMRLHDESISELLDDEDPLLKSLQKRGYAHEDEFLEDLKLQGKNVVTIDRASADNMLNRTREAMAAGAEIIAQAYLAFGNFGGLADFLVKVPGDSNLGNFHYEVWDTKLSRKMKPYFAVQLCCYAEMLSVEQGIRPENVTIVLGNKEQVQLRVQDYFAYFLSLKSSFLKFQEELNPDQAADPAMCKSFGRWTSHANQILETSID